MRVPLHKIAHTRSGDKGDGSNVGLIAYTAAGYAVINEQVTAERVKAHFAAICHGKVERFQVPNLHALNFMLHDSLGGGGTASLQIDAQGKTHGQGLLQLDVEVDEDQLASMLPPDAA